MDLAGLAEPVAAAAVVAVAPASVLAFAPVVVPLLAVAVFVRIPELKYRASPPQPLVAFESGEFAREWAARRLVLEC